MMEQSISTATETACLSYRAHTHTLSLEDCRSWVEPHAQQRFDKER